MSDFRNLAVWQKAHALAIDAHRVAMMIRGSQYTSMRSQIIRASMSVPANIVEGREQHGYKDFARFLRYSIGSASELESHLQIAVDLKLITTKDFETLLDQVTTVRKMLHGLIRSLDRDQRPASSGR